MVQFKIAKRVYFDILIYFGMILLICAVGLYSFSKYPYLNMNEENAILVGVFLVLIWVTIFIVPNLPIKIHKSIGDVIFTENTIAFEKKGTSIHENINNLESLKVKLIGWDGQHRYGDVKSIGKGSLYPSVKPMDGLGNFVHINNQQKIKFYVDSISDYEELKSIVTHWGAINENFKVKIIR